MIIFRSQLASAAAFPKDLFGCETKESRRPAGIRFVFLSLFLLTCCVFLPVLSEAAENGVGASIGSNQIKAVRSRIENLQTRLEGLHRQVETARKQQEELDLGIQIAQARVEEIRLILQKSRDEIVELKEEITRLAADLRDRRRLLAVHVQLAALLGRPGPLQLMWDALRGGHLEEATSLVFTLTRAQATLVREYGKLRDQRAQRMGDLSRILDRAGQEARELQLRRRRLAELRQKAHAQLKTLEKEEKSAGGELEELKQREAALERLFSRVSGKKRLPAKENIFSYRGALLWPVKGRIVLGFGKHYLAKYATYTLCNGVRMRVTTGREILPGFSRAMAIWLWLIMETRCIL